MLKNLYCQNIFQLYKLNCSGFKNAFSFKNTSKYCNCICPFGVACKGYASRNVLKIYYYRKKANIEPLCKLKH